MGRSKVKSKFLSEIDNRGFIYQSSNLLEIDDYIYDCERNGTPAVAYAGFDMTANSLHVGNLVSVMLLKWFEKCGHKPIILLGSATTQIGDPSFKNKTRPILSQETIENNLNSISNFFHRIFDKPLIVDNYSWIKNLNYIEMLKEIGPHFSINKMVSMEIFSNRLKNELNLSFLEFNYLILQSYDFLHLNNKYNCKLQFGGSDQWSNIINGANLVKKKNNNEAFALTTPLITNSNGEKMGKSVNGAIWLNEDNLPNYDFWQFWRNTVDDDVIKFLKLYTFMPLEKIEEFEKLSGSELNSVKELLADEVTKFIRPGFKKPDSDCYTLHVKSGNLKDHTNNVGARSQGINIVELLTLSSDVCKSKSEARRLLKSNAVKAITNNDIKVLDENAVIYCDLFIQIGKKRKIKIEIS